MAFRSLRFFLPLAVTAAGWVLATWGCSASNNTSTSDATSTETSSGTGAGGSGGSGGGGENLDGGLNFGGNSGTGGFTSDASCASTSVQAEFLSLDMLILLDRSGSMSGTKWNGSTAALINFVNDPDSVGINVGIQYFPITNIPAGKTSCDYTLYDDLAVPVGELPMNAPALVTSINNEDPNGADTPMYGAIKGVLFNATAYQDTNPTHKVIMVFASDGDPNGCSTSPVNQNNIDVIAGLAASALHYNGVQTYVIAIQGSTVANLNKIAAAGGTTAAYDVTNDINAFSDKMNEIRATAVPACEFQIPSPPEGQELDYDKVSVRYTSGSGDATEIPKADDADDCGQGAGWYYDDNFTPSTIILCPASCEMVQDDVGGHVEVLFGCEPPPNN